MKKVIYYTILLFIGLVSSQTWLPKVNQDYPLTYDMILFLTYTGLAYIMFFVGLEFQLDKTKIKSYKTDYIVAFTAATFPWILTSIYLLLTQFDSSSWTQFDAWKEVLFIGRFAAPTSAGILFTLLAAAGLMGTWVYKKIRVLAIFDDLDTVLLLIPLKIMVIGLAWQLGVVLFLMIGLCIIGWYLLRKWNLPISGAYPLLYALLLAIFSKTIYYASLSYDPKVPIHFEVLFPAFILGIVVSLDKGKEKILHEQEKGLAFVGALFMLLVGLNMPFIWGHLNTYTWAMWSELTFHVLLITLLSNLGKMYVLFNYRQEASFKERLAVGIGMLPRGEVGAGILVMAIGLGLSEKILIIAMASLVLNLVLTGLFIYWVKKLCIPPKPIIQIPLMEPIAPQGLFNLSKPKTVLVNSKDRLTTIPSIK